MAISHTLGRVFTRMLLDYREKLAAIGETDRSSIAAQDLREELVADYVETLTPVTARQIGIEFQSLTMPNENRESVGIYMALGFDEYEANIVANLADLLNSELRKKL